MSNIILSHTATFVLSFNKNEVRMLEINQTLKGVSLSSEHATGEGDVQTVHYTLQSRDLVKLYEVLIALKELSFQYPSLDFVELPL